MFVRRKKSKGYCYLQVVENWRENGTTKQRVIGSLGREDELRAKGSLDALIGSLSRFSENVQIIEGYRNGNLEAGDIRQIGPDHVFGRLWQTLGIGDILNGLLRDRKFEFPVERAIYLTVLHRLFESGSDRAGQRWRRDVRVEGAEGIELHQSYRAMRWLGEMKDLVEEAVFSHRRNMFTELTLAFFDTTSIYFEGAGGESLGEHGYSKDHRPDLKQMVMGVVLTGDGHPVCCEMWHGKQADYNSLLPVVDRVRERFGIKRVCWVADRGMISNKTIKELEDRGLEFIFGARMRSQNEVKNVVLRDESEYETVADNLNVKDVMVDERRYVVCQNPAEALKDAADRADIVADLRDKLKERPSSLVGNKGFKRFLSFRRPTFEINEEKIKEDALFDGMYVLRTNTKLPASEVAQQYKRLNMVEQFFRAIKSVLDTRPIYHKWDATIKGHVFCSFLALVLLDELQSRMAAKGWKAPWHEILRDLETLTEIEVRHGDQWYRLRTKVVGVAGKVMQAAGVAAPSPVKPGRFVVPTI